MPKKKRDREEKALAELLEKYSLEEVEKTFAWVKKHGEPRTGNPVHTPMAFLGLAMVEVLGKVAEVEKLVRVAEAQRVSLRHREEISLQVVDQERERQEIALRAFEETFPGEVEQRGLLKDYLARNHLARLVPERIARGQAIAEWFQKQRKTA